MTRWIELEGVVNMRDMGDLPTADGRRTRTGRLIRSDNLQDLSPTSVSHLVDVLGLLVVGDGVLEVDDHRDHTLGPASADDLGKIGPGCRDVQGGAQRDGEPLRIRMVGADADGETAAALASAPGEDQGASITPLFGEVLAPLIEERTGIPCRACLCKRDRFQHERTHGRHRHGL